MIDIEKIFSNFRITNEAIEIQEYINNRIRNRRK
jgi:hypothetical protein